MKQAGPILEPLKAEGTPPPATPQANLHLTSGRLLARNTVWNLIGSGAPMIVAAFSIPILIRGLGGDRFGVLALTWALVVCRRVTITRPLASKLS